MSYDAQSSLNRYEMLHPQSMIDSSMDRITNPKPKSKMKSKRNSSICKMIRNRNSTVAMHAPNTGYGGAR